MDNLAIPQWATSQDQPDLTVNSATVKLSSALSDYLAVSMSGGDVTLTSLQFQSYMGFNCSGATTVVVLTIPAFKRALFYVENNNTASLTVTVGSTSLSVPEGETVLFQMDGTANGLSAITPGAPSGTAERDVPVNYSGKPGASQQYNLIWNRSTQLPVALAGSNFYVGTNPTSSATFTLYKNGSSIGTIVISTGGSFTVTFTTLTSFSAGDVFRVVAPGTQDLTLADVSFDFLFNLL